MMSRMRSHLTVSLNFFCCLRHIFSLCLPSPSSKLYTFPSRLSNHIPPLPNPTDIRTWFSNVEQHATEGVNKILIGNKCDWEEKRAVSTQQGQALADELGIPFMEVSAKSNINVEKAFFALAGDIKRRIVDTAKTDQGAGGGNQGRGAVNVQGGQGAADQGGKCC